MVCLLSAPAVYELTDEVPAVVQLAVPKGTWPPKISYPPVEVFSWDRANIDLGINLVEAAPGESIRIYSPTRTVVDLMRLRVRIGEPVASIAIRRYLERPDARLGTLMNLAGTLGVLGPVRAAADLLIAS